MKRLVLAILAAIVLAGTAWRAQQGDEHAMRGLFLEVGLVIGGYAGWLAREGAKQ